MHRHPHYYPIRNHLIDFLVDRSKRLAGDPPPGFDPRHPPEVAPGQAVPAVAPTLVADAGQPTQRSLP